MRALVVPGGKNKQVRPAGLRVGPLCDDEVVLSGNDGKATQLYARISDQKIGGDMDNLAAKKRKAAVLPECRFRFISVR